MTAAGELESVACFRCQTTDGPVVVHSSAQLSRISADFDFRRCPDCGLVRLDPRPAPEAVADWYADYGLHTGAQAWGTYAPLVEASQRRQDARRVARVRREWRRQTPPRVLDVGCGRPTFLRVVRDRLGASATGIDISDAGWSSSPSEWEGLSLRTGTVHDLSADAAFDVVTLWHALEHAPDPVRDLQRIRDITVPGGVLVVEVPDGASWSARWQGPHWAGLHTPRHTVVFEPSTLKSTLEHAGWTVRHLVRWGTFDPFVLWWLSRQERIGRPAIGPLEDRFVSFVLQKMATLPLTALHRWIPLGVMTVVAERPAD